MHRLSNHRAVAWTAALLAVVLVAVTAAAVTFASSQARNAAVPALSNGGARQWVSFDPEGREIGPVQFLSKIVRIANTSTATNRFTIYYEPAHTPICVGTLAAGQAFLCGVQPTTHLSGGYFQVIAARPS